MGAPHAYMWMARPVPDSAEPEPATVKRLDTQSRGAAAPSPPPPPPPPEAGSGGGNQRSWLGVSTPASPPSAATLPKFPQIEGRGAGTKGACATEGRMRYSHERRLRWRGTVKAVPDSCSA